MLSGILYLGRFLVWAEKVSYLEKMASQETVAQEEVAVAKDPEAVAVLVKPKVQVVAMAVPVIQEFLVQEVAGIPL